MSLIRRQLKKVQTFIRTLQHSGTKYECPYCGFKSSGFYTIGLPHKAITEYHIIGAGQREAGCYKCDSIDRQRLLHAYLDNELKVFTDKPEYSILHLAPEHQLSYAFLKYQYKQYVCTDKFFKGYSYPKHVIDMDIMNITFPDNTFDLIICNHVLEHIPDDMGAMKELNRVLKPGGTAILQVPISATLQNTYEDFSVTTDEGREEHFGQFDHVRIYGQDYVNRLESAGFKVNRVNISSKYEKYGVDPEEDLFICTK